MTFKKENGKWIEVKIASNFAAFRAVLCRINRFSSVDIEENWEDFYGELEDGEYRYSKELCIENNEEKQFKNIGRISYVFTVKNNDKTN